VPSVRRCSPRSPPTTDGRTSRWWGRGPGSRKKFAVGTHIGVAGRHRPVRRGEPGVSADTPDARHPGRKLRRSSDGTERRVSQPWPRWVPVRGLCCRCCSCSRRSVLCTAICWPCPAYFSRWPGMDCCRRVSRAFPRPSASILALGLAFAAAADTNNLAHLGGYDVYFGRYEIDTAKRIVAHILDGALGPADVGRRLTRRYRLDGATLTLQTGPGGGAFCGHYPDAGLAPGRAYPLSRPNALTWQSGPDVSS